MRTTSVTRRLTTLVLSLAAAGAAAAAPAQPVSPAAASAWAADIHTFFASPKPDWAVIERALTAMSGLNLSDPAVQKVLAPVTNQIRTEADALLRKSLDPSDPELVAQTLKLRVLTQSALDRHLSQGDQVAARGAFHLHDALLAEERRRLVTKRFAELSRALDGEASSRYIVDHSISDRHENAARLEAAHDFFQAAGVDVAQVEFRSAFDNRERLDRHGDYTAYISIRVQESQLAKARQALAALPAGRIDGVDVEVYAMPDAQAIGAIKDKRGLAAAALAVRNHFRAANVNVVDVQFYSTDPNYKGGTGDWDSPRFTVAVAAADFTRARRALPDDRSIAGIEVYLVAASEPLTR